MLCSSLRAGISTDTIAVLPAGEDRQLSRIQTMLVTASTKKYTAATTTRRITMSTAACSKNGVTGTSFHRSVRLYQKRRRIPSPAVHRSRTAT